MKPQMQLAMLREDTFEVKQDTLKIMRANMLKMTLNKCFIKMNIQDKHNIICSTSVDSKEPLFICAQSGEETFR